MSEMAGPFNRGDKYFTFLYVCTPQEEEHLHQEMGNEMFQKLKSSR